MIKKENLLEAGGEVFLCEPTLKDQVAFIEAVRSSQSLHAPWVFPADNAESYQQYLDKSNERAQNILIKKKEDDSLVGVVNASEIVRGCFQNAYLGYFAFVEHAGKGLMSEGFLLALSYCFNELGLHRVEANIQPDNHASIRFVEKHGFRREGLSLRYLQIDGVWRDHLRYALTSEECRD